MVNRDRSTYLFIIKSVYTLLCAGGDTWSIFNKLAPGSRACFANIETPAGELPPSGEACWLQHRIFRGEPNGVMWLETPLTVLFGRDADSTIVRSWSPRAKSVLSICVASAYATPGVPGYHDMLSLFFDLTMPRLLS